MFEALPDYRAIFPQRGASYDAAMRLQPAARDAEFHSIVGLSQVESGDRILDAPSGGGYLARYLPPGCEVIAIDPTDLFSGRASSVGVPAVVGALDRLPFPDHCFDHVISLAGLHHESHRRSIFVEWSRCLKGGGALTIGDVRRGSRVAEFLDGFVNDHNPSGHRGDYLSDATVTAIREASLTILHTGVAAYRWRFDDSGAAAQYCRLMFGIDADDGQILAGLEATVGTETDPAGFSFHWELLFIHARSS